MDEGELRLSLTEHLTSADKSPQGMVLLVDEAQALPLRLLDEVRALTNLVHEDQPRVRLVVAGNRLLEERFASPKLESFSQRVVARCYLESLNRTETQEYIHALVAAVGAKGPRLFPAESCNSVYKATDGVPRLINQVCDHALLLACAGGKRQVEPGLVEEAWADLQQLPTPWNEQSDSDRNIIEFGGLDDEPADAAKTDAAAAKASDARAGGKRLSGRRRGGRGRKPDVDAETSSPSLHVVPEIDESEAAELEPSGATPADSADVGGRRAGVLPGRHDRPRGRVGFQRAGASLPRVVPGGRSDSRSLRDARAKRSRRRRARQGRPERRSQSPNRPRPRRSRPTRPRRRRRRPRRRQGLQDSGLPSEVAEDEPAVAETPPEPWSEAPSLPWGLSEEAPARQKTTVGVEAPFAWENTETTVVSPVAAVVESAGPPRSHRFDRLFANLRRQERARR